MSGTLSHNAAKPFATRPGTVLARCSDERQADRSAVAKRQAFASRHMTALADIYNGAAHGLFRAGDPAFREALAALRLPPASGPAQSAGGIVVGSCSTEPRGAGGESGQNRDASLPACVDSRRSSNRPRGKNRGRADGTRRCPSGTDCARRLGRGAPRAVHLFPRRGRRHRNLCRGLAEALRPFGVHGAIAAPGDVDDSYLHDDLPIFRFATERGADLERAYGAPDPRAARSFMALIARLRPRIVCVCTPARRRFGTACRCGARGRGEGRADLSRADRQLRARHDDVDGPCALRRQARPGPLHPMRFGAARRPPLLRGAIARTPQAIGDALGQAGLAGGAFTALRLASLIGAGHRRFAELARKVDRIVAPCRWVGEVLPRGTACRKKNSYYAGRDSADIPEGRLCRGPISHPGLRAGC